MSKKVDGIALVIIRQASEAGQLYGSVAARDIVEAVAEQKLTIERRNVMLDEPLKALGVFPVRVSLHPEVTVSVTVNIARSPEEAKIQAERGKAVTGRDLEDEEEAPLQDVFEAGTGQPET